MEIENAVIPTAAQMEGFLSADVTRLMLGAVEELWDEVAIAMYPSREAMLQMIQMPEYA